MRIELPERVSDQKYEFIGGQLTRISKGLYDFDQLRWVPERTELIARLDRGEVLEIGPASELELRALEQARAMQNSSPNYTNAQNAAVGPMLYESAMAMQQFVDWSQDAGPQERL